MAANNTTKKRKRTMKKAMGRAGGLLGRAGRGLMGRGAQIEKQVSGNGNSRKKAAPKKKRAATKKKMRRY